MKATPSSPSRSARVWLIWLLVPLLIGSLVSFAVPRPAIGVIYLDDSIYSSTGRSMTDQIRYANETPQVRAVVLVLNTPGGTVSDTESVYRELTSLRQTKPVVAVIESMSASGGYYLSCGTDYIFAKSSSMVGNVGVIGYMPPSPIILEDTLSTGPYKLWGYSRDDQLREIEMHKQGFWQVVKLGRGDALKAAPEEVLTGRIWSGTQALALGLVDELGSVSNALEKAAQMAKIRHYEVINLADKVSAPVVSPGSFFQIVDGSVTAFPQKAGMYMLYIPVNKEPQP